MTNIPDDNVTKDNAPHDNLPKDNVPGVNDNSAKQTEDIKTIKDDTPPQQDQTGTDNPEIIRRGNRGQ